MEFEIQDPTPEPPQKFFPVFMIFKNRRLSSFSKRCDSA